MAGFAVDGSGFSKPIPPPGGAKPTAGGPGMLEVLVVDSGAIIKGERLETLAKRFVTVPEVIQEIRDKHARSVLENLPFELELRAPSPEAMAAVRAFAQKTGDARGLSLVDLRVLALTYMFEKELKGVAHLRTEPRKTQPRSEVHCKFFERGNCRAGDDCKFLHDPAKPAAWAARVARAKERAVCVAIAAATTEEGETKDTAEEEVCVAETSDGDAKGEPVAAVITAGVADAPMVEVEALTIGDRFADADEDDEEQEEQEEGSDEETKSGVATRARVHFSGAAEDDEAMPRPEDFPSLGCGVCAVDDEDGFPTLGGAGSDSPGPVLATPATLAGGGFSWSTVAASPEGDAEDGSAAGTAAAGTAAGTAAWGSVSLAEQRPAQSLPGRPGLGAGDGGKEDEEEDDKEAKAEGASAATAATAAAVAVATTAAAAAAASSTTPPVGSTAASTTKSRILGGSGGMVTSSVVVSEGSVGASAGGAGDDGAGAWVTPGNLTDMASTGGGWGRGTEVESLGARPSIKVGCITIDFAMQNVLLGIGLHLLSTSGMVIRRLKQWVLKCDACFKICHDMTKIFCPVCGNDALAKLSVTVKDGRTQFGYKKNRKVRTRGTKFSLPKPKGGRGGDLLLREDQLMQGIWAERARKKDTLHSMFGEQATEGFDLKKIQGAEVVVGFGRRNPNDQRGRERRGKKKKNTARR